MGRAVDIVESIEAPSLRQVLDEVLERSPDLAAAAAQALALAARVPQASSLPDPTAGLTGFVLPPETRVGPQRAMAMLSQRVPWFGKLALKERSAFFAAASAEARVETQRLAAVTEARRLYYELGFLAALSRLTRTDLETLRHYEELARARYESGVGLQQGVIKLQAEITRDETKLLQIAENRARAMAALNALRDRPEGSEIRGVEVPRPVEMELEADRLRAQALVASPELWAADAAIERARTETQLAQKATKPDFNFALTYGWVGRRDDLPGRLNPPSDSGQDVLGLAATINLPIWRSKLAAGVEESSQRLYGAEAQKRRALSRIDRSLSELVRRLPLLWSQLQLFENVLATQAEESLNSAESAYSTGSLNSLDLLDAERVLLEVRIATARAQADYAIRLAELEGTVAGPLQEIRTKRE